MKAWELLSSLNFCKGCAFEYKGLGRPTKQNKPVIRSNLPPEYHNSELIGIDLLGAVRLIYRESPVVPHILKSVLASARRRGFKNAIEFCESKATTREDAVQFLKELDL